VLARHSHMIERGRSPDAGSRCYPNRRLLLHGASIRLNLTPDFRRLPRSRFLFIFSFFLCGRRQEHHLFPHSALAPKVSVPKASSILSRYPNSLPSICFCKQSFASPQRSQVIMAFPFKHRLLRLAQSVVTAFTLHNASEGGSR